MLEDPIWNLIARKLSGEATEEDLKELERLINQNPELRYPVQQVSDTWRSSEPKTDEHEVHEALLRHIQRMKGLDLDFNDDPEEPDMDKPTGLYNRRKYLWPALAASVLIGFLFFGFRFFSPSSASVVKSSGETGLRMNQISTPKNSKSKITLSDGTVVLLNAGSSLTYDSSYNDHIREVSLTGEAFFDVAKNKDKPFIIHTAQINIKVLGTEFNVRSYASDKTSEASLIRGSIEVTFQNNPDKKVILKPNEKIVVENNRKQEAVASGDLSDKNKNLSRVPVIAVKKLTYETHTGEVIETSWIQNKLIFQDESFEQIAHQFERWYGVTIVFKRDQLKEDHLTGNFTNETIKQAFEALKLTASFRYEMDKNNNVTIY